MLTVDRSICAAITVPGPIRGLTVSDSIVGDDAGSPDLSVDAPQHAAERCCAAASSAA